ncbi:hypothetical protein E3N88_05800 [Mikania micrantha]|uniref:Uncharacterized protein n=1 Tax=Mikania micrantha TaxID=192012 RepID=A0A5N6PLY3_9ASTR|nr:hypothetical protein E3N88_05800 [Mikania micrantha]
MALEQLLRLLDCWIRQMQEGRDDAQAWKAFSFEFSKLLKLRMWSLMASKAVADFVDWTASRTAMELSNAYRGGFRESNPRDACRAPQRRLLLGHRVPRWAPEEPNKPSLMGLIRSSSFSRFRTIVWPRLNFQVQRVSVL